MTVLKDIEGVVEAISEKNNSVKIAYDGDSEWFDLGKNVKLSYVRKGKCTFSAIMEDSEDNKVITFIKCAREKESEDEDQEYTNFQKSKRRTEEKKEFRPANQFNPSDEPTQRMSALKAAGLIFESTGKVQEFKNLAEECFNWINKGLWVSNEKV